MTYDGDDYLAPAILLLIEDGHGELKLSSIVPRELKKLSIRQANDLLEEFSQRFLEPCAKSLGIEVVLTDRVKDLSHWLSVGALRRFRRFSDGANRRAGYLLPIDRERWLEFVLTAHGEGSKLDADTLRRWLIEIEGWSPEVAERLAGEYAFGSELLSFSESHRAGA